MSNTSSAYERLKEFQTEHCATTKGPLALLIQLTHLSQTKIFPLNPENFLTENRV
jgi:hypothetical protein